MYLNIDAIPSSVKEWNNVLQRVAGYAGTFAVDPGDDPGSKTHSQRALSGGARGTGPSHERSPCKTAVCSETQVRGAFHGEGHLANASSQP